MVVPSQVFTCVCLVLLCIVHVGKTDVFTAIVDLERVLRAENQIASKIKEYIRTEEERLDKLKIIARDYETHSEEALTDINSHLANPLNAFLLVKRFTSDWEKVQAVIQNDASSVFLQNTSLLVNTFPDQEDLAGAATALLRLQDTYALPTDKIAKGELQGVKQSPTLTAADCFELGRLAYNNADHYHTILWLTQALDTLDTEVDKSVERALLLDYLAYSTYVQGNVYHALKLTNQLLALEPNHTRAQNNKYYFETLLIKSESEHQKGDQAEIPLFKNERLLDDYRKSQEFSRYEALCRDEEVVPNPDAHKLTCQYKRHHPLFYIHPLKEETMFLDPWIVNYHDLLTDTEIAKVKELATPKLLRATVQNPTTGVLETAYYRVSKSAWLQDSVDPLIARVSAKVRAMSNLTLDTAEELQVVNYGIGGHYEPHFDFARKEEPNTFGWRGNRVATFICYMTDVEAGGATVFPIIGAKLWPKKGSCAFWYNLKKNGEGDFDTRHAACPVLTGSKWVCNKWIHERGQEFVRPCDLNPDL